MADARAERWICERLRRAGGGLPSRGPAALPGDLTVGEIASAARRHRIHLVLASAETPGHPVREALAADLRRAVLWNALQEAECRRVIDASAAAGVTPVVFKGVALAWSVYEQPWMRPFVDVDLLLPKAAVPALGEVLGSLGYAAAVQVQGGLITHQASFTRVGRAGERYQVDVHWRLFNPEPLANVFTYDELLARSKTLPALGSAARRPDDADALAIAAVHRAGHHNDAGDLIWIHDVDRLARRLAPAGWHRLAAAARERGISALCAAALSRAAACFGTPLPPAVLPYLGAAGAEPSSVFLGGRLGELDIQILNFARLRWRDRGAFLAQHLFPPRAYMRRAYGVEAPARLAWAYAARLASGIPRWVAQSLIARSSAAASSRAD